MRGDFLSRHQSRHQIPFSTPVLARGAKSGSILDSVPGPADHLRDAITTDTFVWCLTAKGTKKWCDLSQLAPLNTYGCLAGAREIKYDRVLS